jgi:hypothetical protein
MAGTIFDWKTLLGRIRDGKCTPILGPEADRGMLPPRFEIARQLAAEYQYPLEDSDDLARVTQFVATKLDLLAPREALLRYSAVEPPDFEASDSVHGLLADLPLPVYVTTAYDNYLVQALKAKNRDPRQELCRWNRFIPEVESAFDEKGFKPTVANPVVFHLHGHDRAPESMVITEDEYLDFLVNTSRDGTMIPPRIKEAFTKTTLLFLGFRLADLEFRVLLRSLASHLRDSIAQGSHVSAQFIQAGKTVTAAHLAEAQEYLTKYCGNAPFNIKVYWGTTQEFLTELKEHRKAS